VKKEKEIAGKKDRKEKEEEKGAGAEMIRDDAVESVESSLGADEVSPAEGLSCRSDEPRELIIYSKRRPLREESRLLLQL